MEPLIEIFRSYLRSTDMQEREQLAVKLVEVIGPQLELFLRSRCKSSADIDDLNQEILVAIALGIRKFSGDHDAQVWAWVYGIARNKLLKYYASHSKAEVVFVDPEIVTEALAAVKAEDGEYGMDRIELEDILSLVRESSSPCVDFLWDRYVVGLPFDVMGENYSISDEAVRKRVERCLQLARQLVSKP